MISLPAGVFAGLQLDQVSKGKLSTLHVAALVILIADAASVSGLLDLMQFAAMRCQV